jgi:hypothetical protein
MARVSSCLFVVAVAFAAASAAGHGARPLPPGRYCLKEEQVKDWNPGPPEVGHFEMYLKVGKSGSRYNLSFWNVRPFAGPLLTASTDRATLLSDGSLEFRFVDGWDNEGRALVYPKGKVVLTKTKSSARADSFVPDGNYETFFLTRAACADKDFARYR